MLKNTENPEVSAARRRLTDSPRTLCRKVSRVAADVNSQAGRDLMTVAIGHQNTWSLADWNAVLDKLDDCDLTVQEWLGAPCLK
jgi:hypothetical protein